MISIRCASVADTHRLAAVIAAGISWGSGVGLSGELGAGKTEFVKGFARALGVSDPVTSPTFVLESQYSIRRDTQQGTLHHWDLYRLGNVSGMPEIEEEIGRSDSIVIVEWPEKIPAIDNLLPLKIMIDFPPLRAPGTESQVRTFHFVRAPQTLLAALTDFQKN